MVHSFFFVFEQEQGLFSFLKRGQRLFETRNPLRPAKIYGDRDFLKVEKWGLDFFWNLERGRKDPL